LDGVPNSAGLWKTPFPAEGVPSPHWWIWEPPFFLRLVICAHIFRRVFSGSFFGPPGARSVALRRVFVGVCPPAPLSRPFLRRFPFPGPPIFPLLLVRCCPPFISRFFFVEFCSLCGNRIVFPLGFFLLARAFLLLSRQLCWFYLFFASPSAIL